MKDNNTTEIQIPFQGFYYSIHDSNLDSVLDYLSEENDDLKERMSDAVDWQRAQEYYAKKFTDVLGYEYGLNSLEFKELSSPKYYNYETDKIYASISCEDLETIASMRNNPKFLELCKEKYTSRSGFISFIDPDPTTWGELKDWHPHCLGTLLLAYILEGDHLSLNGGEDWEVQLDLYEPASQAIDQALGAFNNEGVTL